MSREISITSWIYLNVMPVPSKIIWYATSALIAPKTDLPDSFQGPGTLSNTSCRKTHSNLEERKKDLRISLWLLWLWKVIKSQCCNVLLYLIVKQRQVIIYYSLHDNIFLPFGISCRIENFWKTMVLLLRKMHKCTHTHIHNFHNQKVHRP